jgi:hypothetical protein
MDNLYIQVHRSPNHHLYILARWLREFQEHHRTRLESGPRSNHCHQASALQQQESELIQRPSHPAIHRLELARWPQELERNMLQELEHSLHLE